MTDADLDPAATAETPDPDTRLQRSRRLDWRFLLADPTPGRVGYAGPEDEELLAALRDAGWRVEAIPDRAAGPVEGRGDVAGGGDGAGGGDATDHGPRLDLAIVARPTGRRLAGAAARVRRGGSLYVACDGPFGGGWRRPRPLDPVQVARRLGRLGFVEIRMHAEIPGRSSRHAIVPLEDPAALRLLLQRKRGPVALRPARALAEMGRRTGWLARLAPAASVVARRGPASVGERDAVSGYIASTAGGAASAAGRAASAGGSAPAGVSPAPLLLTPDFRASRHVVALVPTIDGSAPALVAKCSRLADSGAVTRREAEILRDIADASIVRDGAPRLVAVGTPWGLPTLVETGVSGRSLDPGAVRRDRAAAIDLGIPWIAALARPRATDDPPPTGAERLARLLDEPLAAFAAALDLDPDDRRRIDRTLALAEPLRSIALPDVIEHGDVSHPNLLITAEGALAVVDWELAEAHGLPGHDLVGFLAYIATAEAGASTPAEQAAAIIASESKPPAWRHTAEADYARRLGLDPGLLPALTALSWARRTIGLVERLHDGPPRAVTPETAAWLRRHRFVAAWGAAVDRVGGRP